MKITDVCGIKPLTSQSNDSNMDPVVFVNFKNIPLFFLMRVNESLFYVGLIISS